MQARHEATSPTLTKEGVLSFKTEICKNWKIGACTFGNQCMFAHGVQELRTRNSAINHYKSKRCDSYYSLCYCTYGTKCTFKHEDYTKKYFYSNLDVPEIKCSIICQRILKDIKLLIRYNRTTYDVMKYIYEEGLSIQRLMLFKSMQTHLNCILDLKENCPYLYEYFSQLDDAITEYICTGEFEMVADIVVCIVKNYLRIRPATNTKYIGDCFAKAEVFLGL